MLLHDFQAALHVVPRGLEVALARSHDAQAVEARGDSGGAGRVFFFDLQGALEVVARGLEVALVVGNYA